MYTVLIMPHKTSDNMQQYYSALKDVFETENIAVCDWIETGTNIDTALPELYDLIKDIHEWRAIIVCYDEENLELLNEVNPFDYFDKETFRNLERVHEKPLIRLSHLLCGVPLPNREYELEQDQETRKYKYNLKNVDKLKQLTKEHDEWNNNHKINGFAPSEIIFVKTRNIAQRKESDIVRQAWKLHLESESSEFWLRNLYPSKSKFLVYDVEKKGILYEERDKFKFWLAILTLAYNNFNSDYLQPQRLYKLDIDLDLNNLKQVFQDKIKRLNLLKDKLLKSLKGEDNEESVRILPEYELKVPVDFRYDSTNPERLEPFAVRLPGGISTSEQARWENHTNAIYKTVKELIKNVDRELEQAALGLRKKCEFKENDVEVLNDYDEEDFRENISETYDKVLDSQTKLPYGLVSYRDEMKQADEKVRVDIGERMSRKQIITTIFSCTALVLACIIPAFFQKSSQTEVIIALIIAGAIMIGIGFVSVILQKKKFTKDVKKYDACYAGMVKELHNNSMLYGTFLSQVASHIHGSSYLKHLERKKLELQRAASLKKNYLEFIEEYKNSMALWSSALRLSVKMNVMDDFLSPKYITEEDYDKIYSLCEKKNNKRIPLNESGYMVNSPFSFVEKLQIEREEVYDDV